MPIDHKNRFIFIHIPKTAGNSIEVYFNLRKEENLWSRIPNTIDGIRYTPQHYTASMLKNHPHTKDYFDNYLKFAFVRNPYERILSHFIWKNEYYPENLPDATPESFSRWLDKLKINIDHLIPQYDFIYENNKCIVDFVGRFENLQKDFNIILNKLNIINVEKLSKTNQSKIIHNKDAYLSPKNREKIYHYYKKDFDIFGYE